MITTSALDTSTLLAERTDIPASLRSIVCDPSWGVELSMRYIITCLSQYTVSRQNTFGRRDPTAAARVARAIEMRYGLGAGHRPDGSREIGVRAIADALGLTTGGVGLLFSNFMRVASHAAIAAPVFAMTLEGRKHPDGAARPDQTDVLRFVSEVLEGRRVSRQGRRAAVTETLILEPVVCGPSLTIAQSVRFIIDSLSQYSVRSDGSIARYEREEAACAARVAYLRYGLAGGSEDGSSTPAISSAVGLSYWRGWHYQTALLEVAKRAAIHAPALERLANADGPEIAQMMGDEGLSRVAVERFVLEMLGGATGRARRIECDASWTVAQTMRFIICKVCLFRAREDGTMRVIDSAARTEQAMLMRYGVHEFLQGAKPGRATLAVLGATFGYSRERARQIAEGFIGAARCFEIVAPAFDVLAARTRAPFYPGRAEERLAQEIRGDGLSQSDAAFFMKEVLGRATAGEEASSGGREIAQRRIGLEAQARSMVAWAGAAYMPSILERATEGGASPAEVDALREWVRVAPGYEDLCAGDVEWFWFGSTQPAENLVVRIVRQLLSVNGMPVPVADLDDAVARAWQLADAYRPSPRLRVRMPMAAIEAIVGRMADVEIRDGAMMARVPFLASNEISGFELALVDAAQRHGGALGNAEVMVTAGWARKSLMRFTLWARTTYLFERRARGVYVLKNYPVDPEVVERLRKRQRPGHNRLLEKAAVAARGAPFRYSVRLTEAILRKPVLILPPALEEVSPLGKWQVPALGVTITCAQRSTGHFAFLGFVRWLEAAGYRAGDEVQLELDPAARTVGVLGRDVDQEALTVAKAGGAMPRRGTNSKDVAVVDGGAVVSFLCRLTGHAVTRKYIRVPTAVVAGLPFGEYRVRGSGFFVEVVPRASENPTIVGLAAFLLHKGVPVDGVARVSFDLRAREVDVLFPAGE